MRGRKRKKKIIPFLLLLTIVLVAMNYIIFQRPSQHEVLHLDLPPDPFRSHGIDVSHHQGSINWEDYFHAMDSLNPFVYCKATEGIDHLDSEWETNRNALVKLNKKHGAYHFFLPGRDPILQAKHFLRHYNFRQEDLPPALDLEVETNDIEGYANSARIWLSTIEQQTGKRPIIYTSYSLYKSWVKDAFKGYKFWIANYSNKSYRFKDPDIIHWQYSELGVVPGIQGHVDLNYSKIKF